VTDLGWRADGIERARAAGGVELELYQRPGFEAGMGVRRATEGGGGSGFPVDVPDDEGEYPPDPEDR
jgi:hypothetical protein